MHPFRFGIQCRGTADGGAWRDVARRVEDLGWSTLTIADHFDDNFAPLPALMAAANVTQTLRVGSMVLGNDYRHPVVLAKEAATLDVLTGGRFDLGVGAGWMTTDYEAAGLPLDRRAFWDGTSETTDEKVRWVREGAGDRDPELHVRVHLALVTDDREAMVDQLADGFGLTADQARATPHALVGDVSEICDQLVERRERWGISYLGLSFDQLEPFAPVIARLAGT